jgi:hypothetical protein
VKVGYWCHTQLLFLCLPVNFLSTSVCFVRISVSMFGACNYNYYVLLIFFINTKWPSLSFMTNFYVKLYMVIATSACFWTPFSWNTCLHTFTLSLCLSLPLNFCKKQMFGSWFLIQSSSLCLLNGELRSLALRIISEVMK